MTQYTYLEKEYLRTLKLNGPLKKIKMRELKTKVEKALESLEGVQEWQISYRNKLHHILNPVSYTHLRAHET